MEPSSWSSLEIAKLVVGLLTPVALAALGIYIHRVTKRFEHLQWRSQKLIEKRLTIYDDLAPQFNDLLCYFTYVGSWRDVAPPAIIELKRVIDKKVHLAAPLFNAAFFDVCMNFQHLCFETYTGWGRDALLRTHSTRRRESNPSSWQADWDACFSSDIANLTDIRIAYGRIMEIFAQDIGVHVSFVVPASGRVPANIH